jgi:ribosomal protein L32
MGAFADHSIAERKKTLLKNTRFRMPISQVETLGLTALARERREMQRVADALLSAGCADCVECGKIKLDRHVSMATMETTLDASCATPKACPHEERPTLRWKEVKGLDGMVKMIAVPNPASTGRPHDWTDWHNHDADAMRYLSPEDFQSQYMTQPSPAPVSTSPINRDQPVTAAGDAW